MSLQAQIWVLSRTRPLRPSLELLKQPSFWLRRSSQVRTCSLVVRLAQLQWEHTAGPDAAGLAVCTYNTHALLHDKDLHLFPLQVWSKMEVLKGPRQ